MVLIRYLIIIAYTLLERSASRIMIIMKKFLFSIWFSSQLYTFIQSIASSEICALHLTHPSAHTLGAVGQPTLRRPGSSWGFGALLKGLTSVMDNSCRSQDSNPQPRVTSPTLYPLEPRLPSSSQSWQHGLLLFPPERQFFFKYKNKEKRKTGLRPGPRLNYDVKIGPKSALEAFSIWIISLRSNLKLFIYIYLFIMSVIYISIDFSLGKSWRFEKAKLIKHKLWSAGLPLDAWSLR